MTTRTLLPAAGLFALAALALLGQIVLVLLGHPAMPVLDSVLLAGLTGGAAITPPPQRAAEQLQQAQP